MRTYPHLFVCAFLVLLAASGGCMMPRYSRLVPENKDANIYIVNPLYGSVLIQSRVATGENRLAPLSESAPAVSVK